VQGYYGNKAVVAEIGMPPSHVDNLMGLITVTPDQQLES